MAEFTFTEYHPKPNRLMADELIGHRWSYRKRTNNLWPAGAKGRVSYMAKCTCGWKDVNTDFKPLRIARARWEGHMRQARKQMSFDYAQGG